MFRKMVERRIASFLKRPARMRQPPWYSGPPTFPAQSLMPAYPGEITHVPQGVQPVQNVEPDPLEDTHPIRRAHIEPDPLEDTHPTRTVQATTKLAPGAYDHLFPPAQPGDDDYLEVGAPDQLPTPLADELPAPPDDLPL